MNVGGKRYRDTQRHRQRQSEIEIEGVPEFNGTRIQKPLYYFESDLTFCNFLTYIYCEVRLG